MRFFTAALLALLSLAQGELIDLVPDHVKVAFGSSGGEIEWFTDGENMCPKEDAEADVKLAKPQRKHVVMFKGAEVGVTYNVKRVRVYFEDFENVKQATVYVGSGQCGQINNHQDVYTEDSGEGWVELTCGNGNGMEGGYVWIRGDRNIKVCEIQVYVENLPEIPESWVVQGDKLANVWLNDETSNEESNEVADRAVDSIVTQWKKNTCAIVPMKSNNQLRIWTAEFAEPQYVKSVILFTLIEWRQPVSKYVESATVWVVKEDGEKQKCGASISQGEGGIFTPVNMVWCDEIATKVIIEQQRSRKLGLCEVEINAVPLPEEENEEATEAIDERNQY